MEVGKDSIVGSKVISIQILRAIASLLVLQVHLFTIIPFTDKIFCGAIGVDIFFVISGYIISASVARLPQSKPAANFFINRFSRVAPYYYLLTLVIALLTYVYARELNFERLFKSFLFLPDKNFSPTLFLGWSLIHEMFFYLFVCFVILAYPKAKVLTIGFFFFCFISLCSLLPSRPYILTFFGASINYTFILGLLTYVAQEKIVGLFKNKAFFVFACIVLFITALFSTDFPTYDASLNAASIYQRDRIFFYHSNLYLPRIVAWGLPATFFFIAFLAYEEYFKRWKQSLMVKIGDASYSLYLLQAFAVLLVSKIKIFSAGYIKILLAVATIYAALKMLTIEEVVGSYSKKFLRRVLVVKN